MDKEQTVSDMANESGAVEEEEPDVTHAAKQKGEQLGVDLSEVESSGARGRIIVTDVVQAAQGWRGVPTEKTGKGRNSNY